MYNQGDFVYCYKNPSTGIYCPHIVEISYIDRYHTSGKVISSTTEQFDNLVRYQTTLDWIYGCDIPNDFLRKLSFDDLLNQEKILPGYAEKVLKYLLKGASYV